MDTIAHIVADVVQDEAVRVWRTEAGVEVATRLTRDAKWRDPADWAWVVWRRVNDNVGPVPQPVVHHSQQRVVIGDRVVIHWILEADEVVVADALQALPPDASLTDVEAVVTLPSDSGHVWQETRDSLWKFWNVPGSGYRIARPLTADFHPCLREPQGGWIWPTLTALEPLAAMLGYARASSLRVAIAQGRLRSRKQSGVHLVHRDELLTALSAGTLRPRNRG